MTLKVCSGDHCIDGQKTTEDTYTHTDRHTHTHAHTHTPTTPPHPNTHKQNYYHTCTLYITKHQHSMATYAFTQTEIHTHCNTHTKIHTHLCHHSKRYYLSNLIMFIGGCSL